MNTCPSPEILTDYIEGRIKGKQRRELYEHIANCNDCMDALQAVYDMPTEEELKRIEVPREWKKKAKRIAKEERWRRKGLKEYEMKPIFLSVLGALMVLSFLWIPAYGEMAVSPLPRNISIEVEFRETGFKTKKVKVLGQYQSIRDSQYTKQHIVVSDGLTGTIRVGEDVPYIEYYTRYLIDNGYVETVETVFKEIGTKLVVTPKIRGNYIEISLTPQISYISKGKRGVINIKEMTTTVLAADGQSISIGGLLKDRNFADYFFRTESSSNLDIILTPHIQ